MDISLFLESSSPRMSDCTLLRSIPKEALPFCANDAKGPSSISHFPQKMYNIDTDF